MTLICKTCLDHDQPLLYAGCVYLFFVTKVLEINKVEVEVKVGVSMFSVPIILCFLGELGAVNFFGFRLAYVMCA